MTVAIRSKNLLAILVFISFASQSLAQESWWEFYDLALRDIKAKNWSLAEQRMTAALKMQPAQGKKIRAYGARYVRYFPEYYLGVIAFNEGKYQESLELFLKVQNAGLIGKGDEEYPELSELSRQAMAKLNPSAPQPVSAPTREQQFATFLDESRKYLSAKNYDQARHSATEALQTGADDQKAKDFLKKIDLAETTELMHAALDKNDLAEAQRIGSKLEALDPQSPELIRLKDALTRQADEQKTQQQQLQEQQYETLLNEGERELIAKNYVKARVFANQAENTGGSNNQKAKDLLNRVDVSQSLDSLRYAITNKNWTEAQRLVRRIEKLDPQNGELAHLRPSILSSMEVEKPAEEPTVSPAVLAFYSGDYAKSAGLFERISANKKDSAKAYFYLACSNAALAFEQTKEDRKALLLQKARQEFAEARRIDPHLNYDRKFISPRILQIYENAQR